MLGEAGSGRPGYGQTRHEERHHDLSSLPSSFWGSSRSRTPRDNGIREMNLVSSLRAESTSLSRDSRYSYLYLPCKTGSLITADFSFVKADLSIFSVFTEHFRPSPFLDQISPSGGSRGSEEVLRGVRMSQFLSGVDCGPGNALKTVSGRLERDYSPHQVSDEADCSSFGQLAIGFFCLL